MRLSVAGARTPRCAKGTALAAPVEEVARRNLLAHVVGRCAPGSATSRSGAGYGRGRRITASKTLEIAVFAPMPEPQHEHDRGGKTGRAGERPERAGELAADHGCGSVAQRFPPLSGTRGGRKGFARSGRVVRMRAQAAGPCSALAPVHRSVHVRVDLLGDRRWRRRASDRLLRARRPRKGRRNPAASKLHRKESR